MESYLQNINYGNNDIQAGIDNFWFWKLKISATEQVEFLKRFYLEDLDFDPEYIDMVKDIMLQDEAGDYTLYGKTGGGRIGENKFIGWYVGFVETSDNVFIFSMNIDAKDFITARDLREKITREILKAAKAI
jgi:beta-lactamase class D